MSSKKTAVIIGSYDPPHLGHLEFFQNCVDSGDFNEVVVLASKNPLKKRTLSAENSTLLLKEALPDSLKGKVKVYSSKMSNMKLLKQFNAVSIVRGSMDKTKGLREKFQEALIDTFYFVAPRLSGVKNIDTVHIEGGRVTSSSKVKKALFEEKAGLSEISCMVTEDIAETLVTARDLCVNPNSKYKLTKRRKKMFNKFVKDRLTNKLG